MFGTTQSERYTRNNVTGFPHFPIQCDFNSRLLGTVLIVLVISWAITGCGKAEEKKTDIQLSWEIEPHPPKVGVATVTVVLQDSTGGPVEGAQVTLEGNMSHPGMQPVMAQATETEPGRYSAEMELGMAGDWFILVSSTLKDSTVAEHQIDLTGVRPE